MWITLFKSLLWLSTLLALLVHNHCSCKPSTSLFEAEHNVTLHRAIASSTPIPEQYDMCTVKGTIIAQITHAETVVTKQKNLQKMKMDRLIKNTEGFSVTFALKSAHDGKDVQIKSAKSDSQGIVQPTFMLDRIPCTQTWIPIQCKDTLLPFGRAQVQVIPNYGGYTVIANVDNMNWFLYVGNERERKFYNYLNFHLHLQTKKSSPVAWHYVSGYSTEKYTELRQFFEIKGLPAGTFFLQKDQYDYKKYSETSNLDRATLYHYKEKTWDKTQEHKLKEIRDTIFRLFPYRSYVLIGDSSQLDPETYGILARTATVDIKCIYIHKVSYGNKNNSDLRFARAFRDVSEDKWVIFSDHAEVMNADIPNGRCK